MKDQTAEEIFRRYWREFRLIQLAYCTLLAFYVWFLWEFATGPLRVSPWWFLIYLASLAALWLCLRGVRRINSIHCMRLGRVLNEDCDPVKYAEACRLLASRMKKSFGLIRLNEAWGLCWSGRFEEAAAAMSNVDLRRETPQVLLVLRNLDFNCRMAWGDTAGARDIRREAEAYVTGLKRGGDRKAGERLLALMDGSLALEAGNYETFRTIEARLEAGNTTTFQRVVAADGLALAQGERENARARLEFVAANGGTLYVAERARRLLAEMTES